MDNITTSISFSIFSNKGVYGLLLGSGISKSSGIPTGWDIVIDLIKKLATLNNEECSPNPEEWFKQKYKEDPDYSNILSKLVATPSERVNFLKPYFEPTEEEKAQNLKQPTKAHKSIAKLVKSGYIKVIITTNFDRLLEKALQAENIEPTVIRNANDIDGAMPLVHNNFTLIKINGDYLDSRFLNTKDELANYEDKLHSFLLRIINEYGIISCGWSAKWDNGLVNIIRQSENFRFGSYWTFVNKCESELSEIANYRKGKTIKIDGADRFFNEILDKINSLENINDNQPLNADIAIARLKRYIVKDENKILLHDLLLSQREQSYKKNREMNDFDIYPSKENIISIISHYDNSMEILLKLVINGIYWSKPQHYQFFIDIILRIAEPLDSKGRSYVDTKNFHYYPSLILLYSIGVIAIKTQKIDFLEHYFSLNVFDNESEYSEQVNFIEKINITTLNSDIIKEIASINYKTPVSSFLNNKLWIFFNGIISNRNEYNELFDIFELLLSLNFIIKASNEIGDWAPVGEYHWRRNRAYRKKNGLFLEFFENAEKLKENWLPIKAGMFNGDYNVYLETKTKLDNFLKNIRFL